MKRLSFLLRDFNAELVSQWKISFKGVAAFDPQSADFFSEDADALVSPANSFGVMDGGLDLAIRNEIEGIEERVQAVVSDRHHGEMPVGCAEVVATDHSRFPYVIAAPTMRVPENINGTINAYLAFRAVLVAALRFNSTDPTRPIEKIVVPGLGTGVGRLEPKRCASQMRAAYDSIMAGPEIPSFHAIQGSHVNLLGS